LFGDSKVNRKTGKTEPYPNDPALVEFEMVCSLGAELEYFDIPG
jgi:hypothetical protein